MIEHIFLILLTFVWIIFAVVVDLKKREVPNWLNFSLIAIGLSYRAFYSLENSLFSFFGLGILGLLVFFGFANLFYYTRVFAGGDAKLLMGIGVVLPYTSLKEMIYFEGSFILALFFFGAIYSLVYSVLVVIRNKKVFFKELGKIRKYRWILPILLLIGIVLIIFDLVFGSLVFLFSVILSLLYFYIKALDVCMLKETDARDLTEGDWLEKDIWVGNRVIKKSVHGLTLDEILILQKAKKKVLIKEGVPFTPAFLLAMVFMVLFWIV